MLLVHQAGSVHVGEVVRYTLTYIPSADRILPSPTHLYVKIKNTSPIPLRAAYLHGPYSLHVSACPSTFNPHQRVPNLDSTGVPEFEPFLKAGANWTCKLIVPEEIRETGVADLERGSMDSMMAEKRSESEQKKATWIIEVTSQIIFSQSAAVHFEVLVGRDERSLDLGFAAVAGHGHGGPGQVSEHKRSAREGGRRRIKGVYSRAVRLSVEDTEDLWNKPKLPEKVGGDKDSNLGTYMRNNSIDERAKPETQTDKIGRTRQQKVHLVILTHGLHSNLSADMLFMKESIDATVAQARAEARDRKAKRRSASGPGQRGTVSGSVQDRSDEVKQNQEAATQPLTGGQEELDDGEDEEEVVVRGFSGNAVRTERGIQYLGKRLAKYILHLTYPSQPFLPVKRTMSQSISSKFGNPDPKVTDKYPASHRGSSIHKDKDHIDENHQAYRFTSISFIGHSLGGLVQLYAIAYIQKHAPLFFKLIEPVNFVCMASPLLGLSNENPMYVKFALDFGLVGRTGQDLGLTWRAPTIAKSGWSAMGSVFGSGQKDQKEEDPGSKPLLRILPTGPAHQVLHLFRNRTLYSNVVNDGIVPLRTSCLLFLDWKGLGKVDKFRRENGLIGTVAEWGWAEITGATAERKKSLSPQLSSNPTDRELSESGTNTPTRQGHGETVPQPSDAATQEDNEASGLLNPAASHVLRAQSHSDGDKNRSNADTTKPGDVTQGSGATSSMFTDFWNFFKPTGSQQADKKPPRKSVKAMQRGQTLTKEQEEAIEASNAQNASSGRPSLSRGTTDNPTMRPSKRPIASRGDSSDRASSGLSAPPKTSVFEAASDILHPPVPSTQWIVDPSSRPRTIFHDRVYHPSDIPPPPLRRPSRLTRSFSSDSHNQLPVQKSGKTPSLRSSDSNASLNSDQGGMKVEEKIARAYHRDLSWRKVLVKLEPDAHNNMIVRRMFANAYGWPVVKHLCDTHFGDTFSANTRDEDEPGYDRANVSNANQGTNDHGPADETLDDNDQVTPLDPPKRERGEEVAGQTAHEGPVRHDSELREVRDELGSLDRSTADISAIEAKHRNDTVGSEWSDHFFSDGGSGSGSSDDDDDRVEQVRRVDGRSGTPRLSQADARSDEGRRAAGKNGMHLLHTGSVGPAGKGRDPDIFLSPTELADRLTAEPESLSPSESNSPVKTGSEGLPTSGLPRDPNDAMVNSAHEQRSGGPRIIERVVDATVNIEEEARNADQ